jgi:hypothetical protein
VSTAAQLALRFRHAPENDVLCLLAVGIRMFIRRHCLAKNFNPNEEGDAEARKRYGQSRATLLSEQEANDLLAHDVFPTSSPVVEGE